MSAAGKSSSDELMGRARESASHSASAMGNDEREDEDEYVREASRPRRLSSSSYTTPARPHTDRDSANVNESTTGAAGSFMSAGDVESRLFVR